MEDVIKTIAPDACSYVQGRLYAQYYIHRTEPYLVMSVRGNLVAEVAQCTSKESLEAALRLLSMSI